MWTIKKTGPVIALVFAGVFLLAGSADASRQMEDLGRALIAVNRGDDVYIGWRHLATDPDDIVLKQELKTYDNSQSGICPGTTKLEAYRLDGQHPSLIICRGHYVLTKLEAWDYRDGRLTRRWRFGSDDWPGDAIHLSDIDPERAGLEVFDIHEEPDHPYRVEFRDARTGEVIWGLHVGLIMNI